MRLPSWLLAPRTLRVAAAATVCSYLVTLVLSVAVGPGAWTHRKDIPKGIDYVTFYAGGRMVWDGEGARTYDTPAYQQVVKTALNKKKTRLEPLYPPPIFVAMAPLTPFGFRAACILYALAAVSVLLAGGRLLLRLIPRRVAEDRWLARLGLFALWPLAASALIGHPSPLLLVLLPLAIGASLSGRTLQAGLWLGLLAYKPPLAVAFAPVALATLRPRFVLGVALGGLALYAAATPFIGIDAWPAWFRQVQTYDDSLDKLMRYPARMYTVRAAFSLPLPKEWWGYVRWPAFAVGGVLLVFGGRVLAGAFSGGPREAVLLRWGIGCACIVLGAPHLYEYDAILLAVSGAALAEAAAHPALGGERKRLDAMLLTLWLSFPAHMATTLVRIPVAQIAIALTIAASWRALRRLQEFDENRGRGPAVEIAEAAYGHAAPVHPGVGA